MSGRIVCFTLNLTVPIPNHQFRKKHQLFIFIDLLLDHIDASRVIFVWITLKKRTETQIFLFHSKCGVCVCVCECLVWWVQVYSSPHCYTIWQFGWQMQLSHKHSCTLLLSFASVWVFFILTCLVLYTRLSHTHTHTRTAQLCGLLWFVVNIRIQWTHKILGIHRE